MTPRQLPTQAEQDRVAELYREAAARVAPVVSAPRVRVTAEAVRVALAMGRIAREAASPT